MSKIPLGRFVWYELKTELVDAARDFYVDIAGWSTEIMEMDNGEPYTVLSNERGPVAGIMAMPDEAKQAGAPQHWLSYISTPDVDAHVMQARDHGGIVFVPPTDIPDVGRFAVVSDPQGATYAMLAPQEPPQDDPFAPVLGDISWHELMTTDYEQAIAYYSDLFGWEKTEATDMGEAGLYQMFGRHGVSIGGMFDITAEMQVPPNWLIYIKVADVGERAERIKALGGQVLNGPMEVPGNNLIAQCLDPQGGSFAIHAEGGQ